MVRSTWKRSPLRDGRTRGEQRDCDGNPSRTVPGEATRAAAVRGVRHWQGEDITSDQRSRKTGRLSPCLADRRRRGHPDSVVASCRRNLLCLAAPAAAVIVALVLTPRTARAQESCDPDAGVPPQDYGRLGTMFPGAGSAGVPTDGFLRLRYLGRAPLRAFVIVQNPAGVQVTGTTNVVGNEVLWQSDASLARAMRYSVQVPDSTGGNTFQFTTGNTHSSEVAPVFSGVQQATYQAAGAADPCGDANAVQVTLTWNRAISNGWPESDVEYVIFETRGPGISGPIERGRERLQPGGGNTCASGAEFCPAIRLSSANSVGPVCFNVQAMDPYGRSDGNSHETCVDPSQGNFFNGCSVRPEVSLSLSLSLSQGAARRVRHPSLALTLGGIACASFVIARRRRLRAVVSSLRR